MPIQNSAIRNPLSFSKYLSLLEDNGEKEARGTPSFDVLEPAVLDNFEKFLFGQPVAVTVSFRGKKLQEVPQPPALPATACAYSMYFNSI